MRIPAVPTNAAAAVMATGIVGTACTTAGLRWAGVAAFALAAVLFLVVIVLLLCRSLNSPPWFVHTLADPGEAFGWWTLVASLGVCGTLGATLGVGAAPVVALVIGGPIWLILTYGLLPWLLLHTSARPLTAHADGAWFLWVVGTESIAISCATLGFPVVALALWGVGLVLYLLLAAVVLMRMVSSRGGPVVVAPTAWVVAGATAITTLAGARLLEHAPATAAPFIGGASFVLWSWGTWCLPFLAGIGIRQIIWLRQPVRYSTSVEHRFPARDVFHSLDPVRPRYRDQPPRRRGKHGAVGGRHRLAAGRDTRGRRSEQMAATRYATRQPRIYLSPADARSPYPGSRRTQANDMSASTRWSTTSAGSVVGTSSSIARDISGSRRSRAVTPAGRRRVSPAGMTAMPVPAAI
jgi:tellurite resistance protein TehA-like permease